MSFLFQCSHPLHMLKESKQEATRALDNKRKDIDKVKNKMLSYNMNQEGLSES